MSAPAPGSATAAAFAPLPVGATIGILGGGQLGRMLALSAATLGFDVHVYEPEPDCPASRVSARTWTAAWDDADALDAFAATCDAITFEFENVPPASLERLAAIAPVRPSSRSLSLTRDRVTEKTFVNGLGLATAPFRAVDDLDDLSAASAEIGLPAILKTRTLGYDGKGQARLRAGAAAADLAAAFDAIGRAPAVLEGFVDFAREVSVVLTRAATGETAVHDVTENEHVDGILATSTVPAAVSAALSREAEAAARAVAEGLGHVGALAVEFFVTRDGRLVVNEIAPRVHNSGHWTIEACLASQFDNHVRAIAGWPLGDPGRRGGPVVMRNLIGDESLRGKALLAQADDALHLYGKREARPGRKMGHVTTWRAPAST